MPLSGTRMASKPGEIRTGPQTSIRFCRLPVRPEGGQGQTHRRVLADLTDKDKRPCGWSSMPSPETDVLDRVANRETSAPRPVTHETNPMAFEKQIEGTRVIRQANTSPQVSPPTFKVVAGGRQCTARSTFTPTKTCSANLYRHIKRRVGRSLKRAHCQGNLIPSRKPTTHKLSVAKSSHFGSKTVPGPRSEQDIVHSHRQHHSSCLYKQGGGMKSGPLCALLWRILNWCTRKQVTLKAQHIPGWLNVIADKLSRLGRTIQTEWSLHPEVFKAIYSRWHQPQVDLFATRFNNKLSNFVSPVPDPQA